MVVLRTSGFNHHAPEMPTDRFAELKARQAVSWGAAPFERVTETFADIHDSLIARLAPRPGESWLDIASGTGPSRCGPLGPARPWSPWISLPP
jgi:hypothetical protein